MKNVVKYKSIYLTIIFKRLILTYLLIALFFIIAPFFVSQSLKVSYFNNSVDRNNAYNLLYIVWIIVIKQFIKVSVLEDGIILTMVLICHHLVLLFVGKFRICQFLI